MNKRFLLILLLIVGYVVCYFCTSFVQLNMNPLEWSEDARVVSVLGGPFFAVWMAIVFD